MERTPSVLHIGNFALVLRSVLKNPPGGPTPCRYGHHKLEHEEDCLQGLIKYATVVESKWVHALFENVQSAKGYVEGEGG
jgi:hypothetical protein